MSESNNVQTSANEGPKEAVFVPLNEMMEALELVETLLVEAVTWKAEGMDLIEARRVLVDSTLILLWGQKIHGRDYPRSPGLDLWLEEIKLRRLEYTKSETAKLDLTLFLKKEFQEAYRIACLDIAAKSINHTTDANETPRAKATEPVKGPLAPVKETFTANAATKCIPANAAQAGTIANAIKVPSTANDGNAAIVEAKPQGKQAKSKAAIEPKVIQLAQSSVGGNRGATSGGNSSEDMDVDDEPEMGKPPKVKGSTRQLLKKAEIGDDETQTEGTGTVTDEGGSEDGEGEDDIDVEGSETQTDDATDRINYGSEIDRAGTVEKRAQEFEEAHDRQTQKRRKLYKSPKKNKRPSRGIVQGGSQLEINVEACELCAETPGQICFKQDPLILKRPAICCLPCRQRQKKCSLRPVKASGEDGDTPEVEGDRLEEEDAQNGPAEGGRERESVVIGDKKEEDNEGERTRAVEKGGSTIQGDVGSQFESRKPRAIEGAGKAASKAAVKDGAKDLNQGMSRANAVVRVHTNNIGTHPSDLEKGAESGGHSRTTSKRGKAVHAKSVQSAGATERQASRPRASAPVQMESTNGQHSGSTTTSRPKQAATSKPGGEDLLDGKDSEGGSVQIVSKNSRARSANVEQVTTSWGKRSEGPANEMDVDKNEQRQTSLVPTFRRVAPGGVDEATQRPLPGSIVRIADDQVALESRVTDVDSQLRVVNRRLQQLDGQYAAANSAISGISTTQTQDRGAYHDQLRTLEDNINKQGDALRVNNAFVETVSQRANAIEAHHGSRLSLLEGRHPPAMTTPTGEGDTDIPSLIRQFENMLKQHRDNVKADLEESITALEKRLDLWWTTAIGLPSSPLPFAIPEDQPIPAVNPLNQTRAHVEWPNQALSAPNATRGSGTHDSVPTQACPNPLTAPVGRVAMPPAFPGAGLSTDRDTTSSGRDVRHGVPIAFPTGPAAHLIARNSQIGLRQGGPAHVPVAQAAGAYDGGSTYVRQHTGASQDLSHRSVSASAPHAPPVFTPQQHQATGYDAGHTSSGHGGEAGQQVPQALAIGHNKDSTHAYSAHAQNPPIPAVDPQASSRYHSASAPHHDQAHGNTYGYGPLLPDNASPQDADRMQDANESGMPEQDGGNSYEYGNIPPGGMTAYLQAPLTGISLSGDPSISRRVPAHHSRRAATGSTNQGASMKTSSLSSASTASRATNEANFASAPPRPSTITSVGGGSAYWADPGSPLTETPSTDIGSSAPSNKRCR